MVSRGAYRRAKSQDGLLGRVKVLRGRVVPRGGYSSAQRQDGLKGVY
jgi:hypothetical protein